MPSYTIQAPNGKTYTIDGPPGASEEDVRAEILRRDPSAGSAPKDPNQPTTLIDAAVRTAKNFPGDVVNSIKGNVAAGVNAITHPVETVQNAEQGAADLAQKAGGVIGGGVQRIRDMSPAAMQGSAPRIDTSAYDAAVQQLKAKYGSKNAIYKTVSDHPVDAALTAASLADPALKVADAVGSAIPVRAAVNAAKGVATAPLKTASAVRAGLADVTSAERRGMAASNTMRDAATADYSTAQDAAAAQAAADADRAQRAAALAQRAKARQATLQGRQAVAEQGAAIPEPAIGPDAQNDTLGNQVRDPALAKQSGIEANMRAADATYRDAMNAVANEQAAKGVSVSDTAAGKALIAKSEAIVSPDPVTRPDVGPAMANDAGGKLHAQLVDTLKPKNIPLTADQAKVAAANGVKVLGTPKTGLYRVVKPDMQTVDNFRRFVGQVLDGNVEGYPGLNQAQAREMYAGLTDALDQYSQGTSKQVQENWATGKRALDPFEKVRAGQKVVGMQPGGGAPKTPAVSIPNAIISGGPEVAGQVAAVAGDEPVKNVVRAEVQRALRGARSSDAMAAKIAPGSKLGPFVAADPDLGTAVQQYLNSVRGAEAQGAAAKDLGARAATSASRADQLNKYANALQGSSAKATGTASQYARSIADLEIADPKQVGKLYQGMLDDAAKNSRITTEQYKQGQQLAVQAEQAFKTKASRDAWLRRAGYYIGAPIVGGGAISLATHH